MKQQTQQQQGVKKTSWYAQTGGIAEEVDCNLTDRELLSHQNSGFVGKNSSNDFLKEVSAHMAIHCTQWVI